MSPWCGQGREIRVQEVALRDGFQSEAGFVPTEKKIKLVDQLTACGLKKIEVSSFVSPRAVPQLADAEAVFQGITRLPGDLRGIGAQRPRNGAGHRRPGR